MQHTLLTAIIGGMVPALLWLFFWLREYKDKPEPKGLIVITFLIGMASVIFILPLEQLARDHLNESVQLTILWAALEEFIKYAAATVIVMKTTQIREPVDFPIYFITAALGFAALENTLFLLHPIELNDITVSLLTGNLRFLGATLLHAVASSFVGISLGLSFYGNWLNKRMHLIFGLLTAITLHSIFNFFIIKDNGENFLGVFGFLWVVTIISMLLFEKLRRMKAVIPA